MSEDKPEPVETDAERKLREAHEKLRLFREQRDAAKKAERDERDAAAALQRLDDEQKVAEWQDKLGETEVKWVHFEKGVAIVKRPTQAHYVTYANKGKDDFQAQMAYVVPTLVHPPVGELEAWLKREPFKITSLAGCVSILAGVVVQDNLAK